MLDQRLVSIPSYQVTKRSERALPRNLGFMSGVGSCFSHWYIHSSCSLRCRCRGSNNLRLQGWLLLFKHLQKPRSVLHERFAIGYKGECWWSLRRMDILVAESLGKFWRIRRFRSPVWHNRWRGNYDNQSQSTSSPTR